MRRTLALILLLGCTQTDKEPATTETDTEVLETDTEDTEDTVETQVDTDTDAALCTRPAGFSPTWTLERQGDPLGMMMSVWGSDDDDVWIVGGQKGGDGFVLRGRHDDFSSVALPADTPMLNWVHGTAADDVWAAGAGGTLLHWDGASWTPHDLPEAGAIWGIHARSADDALAVGGIFFNAGTPFAYRWNGASWTALTLPSEATSANALFKVHRYADGYVVVGSGGTVVLVDDAGVTLSETPTTEDLVTVHRDEGLCNPPIAVGGRVQGHVWTLPDAGPWSEARALQSKANGVHVLGDGSYVVVGDFGSVGWYDAATATWTDQQPFSFELLHAVWVAPGGEVYAVGGNFLTSGPTFAGVLGYSPAP